MDEKHEIDHSCFAFIVPSTHENQRFDITVADHHFELSRSAAANLIQQGLIRVCGDVKKPSYRVHAGDPISGRIPAPEPIQCEPEPISLDILYEDDHLTVLNKPAGIVVHPAPGNWTGTLVAGLLHRHPEVSDGVDCLRPGIVHRLDRDTSGVLITTRTHVAKNALMEQFKARTVRKTYLAIAHGPMPDTSGVMDLPIGRHPVDRKKMAVNVPRGRSAYTEWTLLRQSRDAAFLSIWIKTGRTHQIRVHMQSIGHPVLGDALYGKTSTPIFSADGCLISVPRQMLHAAEITFHHPITLELLHIVAPLPLDMRAVLDRLGF